MLRGQKRQVRFRPFARGFLGSSLRLRRRTGRRGGGTFQIALSHQLFNEVAKGGGRIVYRTDGAPAAQRGEEGGRSVGVSPRFSWRTNFRLNVLFEEKQETRGIVAVRSAGVAAQAVRCGPRRRTPGKQSNRSIDPRCDGIPATAKAETLTSSGGSISESESQALLPLSGISFCTHNS